ncbi:hypothetical protein [Rhodoplanes elegans]|uniref:hypothetical protein n=1 Tax=Rhodoplanes elegans TaxID=29408 RepID=UPI001473F3C4|nr:hypothetical protein [Rhodoplanes elegans]
MLECGCGDHKVGAVIAERSAQSAQRSKRPAPCGLELEGKYPFRVKAQELVEPCRERPGKNRIGRALSGDAAFDLADADYAEKQAGRSLPSEPHHESGIALPFAQFR